MSVGGIGAGYGHVGKAAANRTADSVSGFAKGAFNAMVDAGSVAAGVFGGPAASAAVSSLRNITGSGSGAFSGVGGGIAGEVGGIVSEINASAQQNIVQAGIDSRSGISEQMALIKLQQAVNLQNQTITMLSNMQKANHDARMASVQNMR